MEAGSTAGVPPPADAGPATPDVPRRSIGRNVVVTLLAQIVSWSGAIVVTTMLPRYLGPENVGQFRLASSIWLIAGSFIIFGTDKTVTLQVARREDEIARIAASAAWLRMALWVVAGGAIAVALTVLQVDRTLAILCAIVGFGHLGRMIGSVGLRSLEGLEQFGYLARVTTAMSVGSAVGVALAIVLDVGLYPMAVLLVAGFFITGSLQLWFLSRLTPLGWRSSREQVLATAKRGLPYLLGTVALTAYREVDTIIMAGLVDREQIGWYSTADQLFGTAVMLPTVVMATMLPVFARVHASDPSRARIMAEQTYRTLLLVGLPSGIGLFLISDRLAVLLFGRQFVETGPVLAGFGLALVAVSLNILVGRYALAIGRERFFYTMLLVAMLATVPLDMVLVPFFDERYQNGAIGGAVSFMITEAVILIVGTLALLPTAIGRPTMVRLVKTAAATAAMAAVVYPLRAEFPVFPVALGALAFVLATLVLRTLEAHEWRMLAPATSRLPVVRSWGSNGGGR